MMVQTTQMRRSAALQQIFTLVSQYSVDRCNCMRIHIHMSLALKYHSHSGQHCALCLQGGLWQWGWRGASLSGPFVSSRICLFAFNIMAVDSSKLCVIWSSKGLVGNCEMAFRSEEGFSMHSSRTIPGRGVYLATEGNGQIVSASARDFQAWKAAAGRKTYSQGGFKFQRGLQPNKGHDGVASAAGVSIIVWPCWGLRLLVPIAAGFIWVYTSRILHWQMFCKMQRATTINTCHAAFIWGGFHRAGEARAANLVQRLSQCLRVQEPNGCIISRLLLHTCGKFRLWGRFGKRALSKLCIPGTMRATQTTMPIAKAGGSSCFWISMHRRQLPREPKKRWWPNSQGTSLACSGVARGMTGDL